MFLLWEKSFLQKHEHMKSMGQRLITINMVNSFIEDNLDYLYENRHNVLPKNNKSKDGKEFDSKKVDELNKGDTNNQSQDPKNIVSNDESMLERK